MFIEKKRQKVLPRLLTADGTAHGLVTVTNTRGFFVKQKISIRSNTQPPVTLEIKRFDSLFSFYVGPLPENKGKISDRSDISAYTVADGATIEAGEQDRPGIKQDEHQRAVYVEEPVVAKRVISVDEDGDYYNEDNPLPVVSVSDADDKAWDDVLLARDPVTQDITTATYKKNGNVVRILTFYYDAYENLSEVKKS